MRRDDFDLAISSAILSMMFFTRGRSSGKLLANCLMSPPIACGVNFRCERDAIARTDSDRACAKAVTKSASNSSSLSMITPLWRMKVETPKVRIHRPQKPVRCNSLEGLLLLAPRFKYEECNSVRRMNCKTDRKSVV